MKVVFSLYALIDRFEVTTMLNKLLEILEDIEEDEDDHGEENLKGTENNLDKFCQQNQKNELINIVYAIQNNNIDEFNRYDLELHLKTFLRDVNDFKKSNAHFDRYVIWSLLDCLRKSETKFSYVGLCLKQHNLMVYGAKPIQYFFDAYWSDNVPKRLDDLAIEYILQIWERKSWI